MTTKIHHLFVFTDVQYFGKYIAMKVIASLLTIFVAFFGSCAGAAPLMLKDIRIGQKGLVTRAVLDLSAFTHYKVFTLNNPYRLVIDTSTFTTTLASQITPRQNTAIVNIRHGIFRPHISRTVMQLRYPIRVKNVIFLTGTKPRLVVDMVKVSGKYMAQKSIQSKGWRSIDLLSKKTQKEHLSALNTSLKKYGKPLIVIDAGHGGPDPGSIGIEGVYEKTVTLKMAKSIASALRQTGKFTVYLTRSRDLYIPLRTRYRIAEKKHADLFMSIHADSHRKAYVRGMSVYVLSEKASDVEAAYLAKKENLSDLIVGNDLPKENRIAGILLDIFQSGTMRASTRFAKMLIKQARYDGIRLLHNAYRSAGFSVLKSPKVPSVLIELGYMSNRYDIKNLVNARWRQKVAKTIAKSTVIYFQDNVIQ